MEQLRKTELVRFSKWRENGIITNYVCRGIEGQSANVFRIAISDLFGTKALYPLAFSKQPMMQGRPDEELIGPEEFAKWFVYTMKEILPIEALDAIRGQISGTVQVTTTKCANPRCKSPDFVPANAKQQFCSNTCRVAAFRAAKKLLPPPTEEAPKTSPYDLPTTSPISDKWTWLKVEYVLGDRPWYRISHQDNDHKWVVGPIVNTNDFLFPLKMKVDVGVICKQRIVFQTEKFNTERQERCTKLLCEEIDNHFRALGFDVESSTIADIYHNERMNRAKTLQAVTPDSPITSPI